jgi:hypothetical protein
MRLPWFHASVPDFHSGRAPGEDWYVAQCLEVVVASQGQTIDEALANLTEAVGLYLKEVDDPTRYVTSTPLVTSFQLPGAA